MKFNLLAESVGKAKCENVTLICRDRQNLPITCFSRMGKEIRSNKLTKWLTQAFVQAFGLETGLVLNFGLRDHTKDYS
jgi:hypothetical protein